MTVTRAPAETRRWATPLRMIMRATKPSGTRKAMCMSGVRVDDGPAGPARGGVVREAEADPLPDVEAVVTHSRAIGPPFILHRLTVQPKAAEGPEGAVDAGLGPVVQLPSQPFALRCLQGALRGFDDRLRNHGTNHLTQELLPRAMVDLPLRRLAKGQFKESMVEERLAQFRRGTHGDAVVESQRPRDLRIARVQVLAVAQRVCERRRGREGLRLSAK